VKESTSSNNM